MADSARTAAFAPRTGLGARSLGAFLGVQVLTASVCGAALWLRPAAETLSRHEPALQNLPTEVTPQDNRPSVISDEQLVRVTAKLRPRFPQNQPKINHVDHALRCWGAEVEFADPAFLSGPEMRRLLTDHEAFRTAWGPKTRPLLQPKDHGVAVRTQQGDATASHVDHTLATLAECGTPLDHPVRLAGQSATMRDVLRQAVATFELNQHEYEWTVLALALYVQDGTPWYTPSGERIDFDRLVRRVIRQRYGQGVCYGFHRLYSLTIVLRLDEQKHLLSPAARADAVAHLADATRRLAANQHPDGYWERNWQDLSVPANEDDMALGGPMARRVLATGHALEWWALVPEDLRSELLPERHTIERAAQWLVTTIDEMDAKTVSDNYTFLSHAGRALALWRGTTPAEVILAYEANRKEPDAAPATSGSF